MDLLLKTPQGHNMLIRIREDNVQIEDSFMIKNLDEKKFCLNAVRHADADVWAERSDDSLIAEWKAHNALYRRGKWVSHTRSVDLESKQSLFHKIAWFVVNLIYKE